MADQCKQESSSEDELLCDDLEYFPVIVYDLPQLYDFRQLSVICSSRESIKAAKADAVPFIPFKINIKNDDNRVSERMTCLNLENDKLLLSDRFDRLFDGSTVRDVRTGHEDIDWPALENKYQKTPRLGHRFFRSKTNKTDGLNGKGYADNRLAFYYCNMYLTKQLFTFGVRMTREHECHLLFVFEVPLLFYKLKPEHKVPPEASFYSSRKIHFEAYLLNPSTRQQCVAYLVRPGTTYVLMTMQKTLFSVIRCTERVLEESKNFVLWREIEEEFKPKSPEELERIVKNGTVKRKRGRPSKKSLDTLCSRPRDIAAVTEASEKQIKLEESIEDLHGPEKQIKLEDDSMKELRVKEQINKFIENFLADCYENSMSMPIM